MKLFVVHATSVGYAREDDVESVVIGAYTDQEVARKVARLSYAKYMEVDVDYIPPGIKAAAPNFGVTL